MSYRIALNINKTEKIEASEVVFDVCGGVQFYQHVLCEDSSGKGEKILVKAFAKGLWETVNNEDAGKRTPVVVRTVPQAS